MVEVQGEKGKIQPWKLVSSLSLATFTTEQMDILMSLFLIDIAATFQVTEGVMGQIVTISRLASVAMGFFISVLSVKFRHKTLLLFGVLVTAVGLIGSFSAPNFFTMQLFYPLDGVGTVMIRAMTLALIGQFLPISKRAKAVGITVSVVSLAWIVTSPISGFIAGASSWRFVILLYMLPLSIAGLIWAFIGVPSTPKQKVDELITVSYTQTFKAILKNQSANACLIGFGLISILQSWTLYSITFYRTQFPFVTIESASIILLVVTAFFGLGGIIGSRFIGGYGGRRLLVIVCISRSFLIAGLVYSPLLLIALSIDILNAFLTGIGLTSANCLSLGQIPKYQGPMMSLLVMIGALGSAIGIFIGGMVYDSFGFQIMAPVLAIFGLIAAFIFQFYAKEPTDQISSNP